MQVGVVTRKKRVGWEWLIGPVGALVVMTVLAYTRSLPAYAAVPPRPESVSIERVKIFYCVNAYSCPDDVETEANIWLAANEGKIRILGRTFTIGERRSVALAYYYEATESRLPQQKLPAEAPR